MEVLAIKQKLTDIMFNAFCEGAMMFLHLSAVARER